eukprot:11349218-Heterocapsa_arctica.AAC.1
MSQGNASSGRLDAAAIVSRILWRHVWKKLGSGRSERLIRSSSLVLRLWEGPMPWNCPQGIPPGVKAVGQADSIVEAMSS